MSVQKVSQTNQMVFERSQKFKTVLSLIGSVILKVCEGTESVTEKWNGLGRVCFCVGMCVRACVCVSVYISAYMYIKKSGMVQTLLLKRSKLNSDIECIKNKLLRMKWAYIQ